MEEELSQHSKDVAKGSAWTLAGSGVFYLISFIYNIIIARAVSQDDLGLFFLSLSIASLIAVFDDLGLATSLSRYVPYFEGKGEKGKMRALLRISQMIVCASAFVTIGLLYWQADNIGVLYKNPLLPQSVRMFSLFMLLSNLFNVNTSFIRGRADMRTVQLLQNMQNFLKLAFTVALFQFVGASEATLTASFLLSFLPPLALSFFFVRAKSSDLPSGDDSVSRSQLLRDILPYGIMVSAAGSLSAIIISVSRLLLGLLTDPSQSSQAVAVYSVAAALAGVLLALPGSIGGIFLPIVSRLYGRNDIAQMRAVTQTAQRWSMFLAVPAGLVMMAFAPDIMAALYGEPYRAGGIAMSILSLGFLIKSVSFVLESSLAAMRMVRIQLGMLIVSGALNVALNILLIPSLGVAGSAVASLVGFATTTLLISHYANRIFGYVYPPEIYKLALSGAITLLIVLLASPHAHLLYDSALPLLGPGAPMVLDKLLYLAYLALLVALTMGTFLSLSLMLKCFHGEDIALMRGVLRKAGLSETLPAKIAVKIAGRGVGPGPSGISRS